MSILIKGMEMPKRCEDCPCCHYMENGTITACGCKLTMKIRPIGCFERADWCPLVPVPPHGRLIDADALLNLLNHCMFPSDMVTTTALSMAVNWIKKAPTIIPEEEGET